MRMDLVGTWKMSGKKSNFFLAEINFLNFPKLIFYRFWSNITRLPAAQKNFLEMHEICNLTSLSNFTSLHAQNAVLERFVSKRMALGKSS